MPKEPETSGGRRPPTVKEILGDPDRYHPKTTDWDEIAGIGITGRQDHQSQPEHAGKGLLDTQPDGTPIVRGLRESLDNTTGES